MALERTSNAVLLTPDPENIPDLLRLRENCCTDPIIRTNLGLVAKIVSRLVPTIKQSPITMDEAIQAGVLGLEEALGKHNPQRGRLSTIAYPIITGRIIDTIRASLPLPKETANRKRKIEEFEDEFYSLHGRNPTLDETSSAMGLHPKKIAYARTAAKIVSLELAIENAGQNSHLASSDNSGHPEKAILIKEEETQLAGAIAQLEPRLRAVVIGYFFENKTQDEVGATIGVSGTRVRQLLKKALGDLKKTLSANTNSQETTTP